MSGEQVERFWIGEWLVQPALDQICREGETVKLEPRTMRLLLKLAAAPGEVVSAQALLDHVWAGVIVGPASVYQAVSQLRKLMSGAESEDSCIATVPRKGYRLVAPVRRVQPVESAAALPAPAETPLPAATLPPAATPVRHSWPVRIAAGVAAVALIVACVWLLRWQSSPPAAPTTSIAVLPFVDMSADASDAAFCDGPPKRCPRRCRNCPPCA
jgi:DNA-binding winged helix-turn-helix (wHTH) protein